MIRNFLLSQKRRAFSITTLLFCAFLSSLMASPLTPEASSSASNLSNPQKRQALANSIRERRQPGIERAEEYLRHTGKQKRWTDGEKVFELMAIENGQFIVYTTANADSAISIAADVVRDNPYYWMSGDGITVGVWDEGAARPTHQELIGRVVSKDGSGLSAHSTHVTGIIAAAGVDTNATGMAPLTEIDNYDWTSDTIEMSAIAMSSSGQVDKIQISNHSYGNICGWYYNSSQTLWNWYGNPANQESDLFGQYNYLAHDFDEICYNNPYFLPFRAAGNDRGDSGRPPEGGQYFINGATPATFYTATGPYADNGPENNGFDTMSPGACAKNVLTIGAVHDAVSNGDRNISIATMYYKSAWGPTDDGRIKPDLVANGVVVYSCWSSNDTAYYSWSGTSLSSPAGAGAAVQLVDLYGQLFVGQNIRSSTLKGLMIHTADDLGNPGPDYKFGWGLINNERSAKKLVLHKRNPTSKNIINDSLTRNTDKNDTFDFEWDGIGSIKVTLCYTDPPGAETSIGTLDSTTKKLVNDLDIQITDPEGASYNEYVLDYANPDHSANTGDNDRDNVKQIYIETPSVPGTYTVRIDYDTISYLYPTQDYSLFISGQEQQDICDFDLNGSIDLGDLVYLCNHWLTNDTVSDIYPAVGDNWVDLLDFSLLADKWLSP